MVIISILLAVALPGTIDLIQVQRSANEAAELPKIAEAIKRGMLREQIFPIYQNDASVSTDGSDLTDDSGSDAYWWNLAARHGGGSANELRYPLGVRPGADNTRKLYFANTAWSGDSFFEIVSGNQASWIADFQDPSELRFLLLSTTSSDLELPDTLNTTRFNRFWNDWAVGSDGNPATESWDSYGLGNDWAGRAAELNVERIDLRDWLCTVVIENRRAIVEASGTRFDNNNQPLLGGDWESGSIYAYTENQNAAKVVLSTTEDTDGNTPPNVVSRIEAVTLSNRGRVTNETIAANIVVGGSKITITAPGPPVVTMSTPTIVKIPLSLTDRAPMALLNPNDSTTPSPLTGWGNNDDYIQNRYFLRSQELLLGEPWPIDPDADSPEYPEVGIFTISETFSTLRFDGLEWQY